MKRKIALILLFVVPFLLITACSSSNSDENFNSNDSVSSENKASNEGSFTDSNMDIDDDRGNVDNSSAGESESTGDTPIKFDANRMIIHTAQLELRVKDFNNTQANIENKVNEYGGYVVESSVYGKDEQQMSGHMIVRIPEKHFQKFLTETEGQASEVLSRDVGGQDVTEQYVDLESRLKSKRVVEERLLTFMNDAKKTEDLLKISDDLATIQEEIEVVVGKMNYLENQSAYSTIEISMHEQRVIVPNIDNKDLDTWEKTKKQFIESVNFILKAGSGLIVFFIGNLPVIILFLIVGVGGYLIVRRKKE